MKRYGITIAVFCLLAGAFAFVQSDSFAPPENLKTGVIAKNLAPGTKIDYAVFAGEGGNIKGSLAAGTNGTVQIEDDKLAALGKGAVTYDLTLGNDKTSNIRLVLDEASNILRLSGRGLEKFSDVKLSYENAYITAKTDWAGKFQQVAPFDFTQFTPGQIEKFQITFQGQEFPFTSGPGIKSLSVIDVLFAPGGGRPPDHTWENPNKDGLLRPNPENNIYDLSGAPFSKWVGQPERAFPYRLDFENIMYFETWCGDKSFLQISVCQNPAMRQQIIDIVENYVTSIIKMTEQLTAVMMQHVQSIGMFMDAKMQMETEREIQALVANAHKTYHPSEQMCEFGTFVRSLADTEERAEFNKIAFNKAMMTTYTGMEDRSTSEGYAIDIFARIKQFKKTYCDPRDNNNGLEPMCGNGGDADRYNNDIDYIRTMDSKLTLDIDFSDEQLQEEEEDIFALARNLYWPRAIEGGIPKELEEHAPAYMAWRNLAAVNSIAHNSFAEIMAMKSAGDPDDPNNKGGHFMKMLMGELGGSLAGDDYLGENPSYYAQMEVLTKKMYQNPDFYTNLYDKPDNVKRIGVTLEAIKNMQGRDRFESALRREMLLGMLVEQAMSKHVQSINARIKSQAGAVK